MASHATQEKGMACKRDRVCTVAARRTEPHLYLAYPSNNTKQQGGGLQQHFPPLDKQPGWPSPQARANPHSNKGTTPTPPNQQLSPTSRRPHPQSNASGVTQLAAAENSATWSRQLRQLLISSYHGRNNSSAEMLHRFDGWNSCGRLAWPSFNLLALSAFSFRSPAMCATSRSHS